MKVLYIPMQGPVAVVEIPPEENLSDLQRMVGGFVERITVTDDPGTSLWLNEEGKIEGLGVNVRAHSLVAHLLRADDVIVGDCVLTGGIDFRTEEITAVPAKWIDFATRYWETTEDPKEGI